MRYDGERDSFVEEVDGFEIVYPSDADGLYAIGPDWLWNEVPRRTDGASVPGK